MKTAAKFEEKSFSRFWVMLEKPLGGGGGDGFHPPVEIGLREVLNWWQLMFVFCQTI